LQEFNALPPDGKIAELQRQLKEMRVRAVTAESELAALQERHEISVDHKDSIIESLKRQNAELSDALEAANMRIAELETKSGATTAPPTQASAGAPVCASA
jgi:predicted RNase H-like nuclease (RuvC/YqgF family)